MTTHMSPPSVVIEGAKLSFDGQLTQVSATRHVALIQRSLNSLEQAIAEMPEGELKSRLQYRALKLHNHLSRGGQTLNTHFQTTSVSPDSAGGDKDSISAPQIVQAA